MITDLQWWKHSATKLLVALLLLISALNSALLYQVYRLQRRIDTIVIPPPPSLQVGDAMPPVQVLGLNGQLRTLSTDGKLLFVFTQTCHVCVENFPNWLALEKTLGPDRVIYVSTDSLDATRGYAQQRGIASRTVVLADPSEAARMKIYRVPQTIAVHDKKVSSIAIGALSQQQMDAFGRNLPCPTESCTVGLPTH
ncbi:MAG TPA: conjugal transfer protein TraF [Terriglobales bacterium]|nr:conjugal transfer protein TraF [Terriglobales bacterium]